MSEYQLHTDSLGRKRLNLQGKVYNSASFRFLHSQGIKKGQSVLEVGCGSGAMTPWLAEQVGKTGRVLAIDSNKSQIKATERLINRKGLTTQVECLQLSVFDLDSIKEKFHIIYVRFVLIHLTEPEEALKQLSKRLKKNGRLVVEEMLNASGFCYPANPYFDQRRNAILDFFIRNNLNPNYGLYVKPVLKKIGFKYFYEYVFQPMLKTKQERKLITLLFYECKDKLISLGILSDNEWCKLVSELQKIEMDHNIFVALSSFYQLSAAK